uniref:Ig-like domain-containing protein n=1 Tax=Astyanax mexicanus TaxID=7994 RepID=A0A8B9LT11_ASTMX
MDVFGGAPRVLRYPRPVLVKRGSDALLRCQIGGDPQPDVVWERKNVPIVPDGRYCIAQDGKVYTLAISGVTLEDAGQYICRAKNSIGETYAAATLKSCLSSAGVDPLGFIIKSKVSAVLFSRKILQHFISYSFPLLKTTFMEMRISFSSRTWHTAHTAYQKYQLIL